MSKSKDPNPEIDSVLLYTFQEMKDRKLWVQERRHMTMCFRGNYEKDLNREKKPKKYCGCCYSGDIWKSIKSLGIMHNETTNSWSHLLYFLFVIAYCYV